MKATHTDYKHPRHLRVEGHPGVPDGVACMSPSHSRYAELNRRGLPTWEGLGRGRC